jgi:hypothetical protein
VVAGVIRGKSGAHARQGVKAARALGLFALVAVAVALLPTRAAALDSDLKHTYAFTAKASNGYKLLAIADSERLDGRGEVVLIVASPKGTVTYLASATVTATRIDADLGQLGRVSLEVTPSGREESVRCGKRSKAASFEPQNYSGILEFHGEEGFAEADSTAPRDYTRFFGQLVCGGAVGTLELGGKGLAGARLRLHAHNGAFHLNFQAGKNRPGAGTRFEVEVGERRRGIQISRGMTWRAGAGAFIYDPSLATALLAPPAPFSGRAEFHRHAAAGRQWSGNLTVDLPGRASVPLTGPGIEATLAPACREKEGQHGCHRRRDAASA